MIYSGKEGCNAPQATCRTLQKVHHGLSNIRVGPQMIRASGLV